MDKEMKQKTTVEALNEIIKGHIFTSSFLWLYKPRNEEEMMDVRSALIDSFKQQLEMGFYDFGERYGEGTWELLSIKSIHSAVGSRHIGYSYLFVDRKKQSVAKVGILKE